MYTAIYIYIILQEGNHVDDRSDPQSDYRHNGQKLSEQSMDDYWQGLALQDVRNPVIIACVRVRVRVITCALAGNFILFIQTSLACTFPFLP